MWQAIGSNNLSQTDEQYILYLVNANSGISYHCTCTYIYIYIYIYIYCIKTKISRVNSVKD